MNIYFVRNHDEYRYITVYDDGKYRIHAKECGHVSKLHDDTTAYISKILRNGWRKVEFLEYFAYKHGKEEEWRWTYEGR